MTLQKKESPTTSVWSRNKISQPNTREKWSGNNTRSCVLVWSLSNATVTIDHTVSK